ncbi:hypothetical protein N7U66_05960 [Lacinutrix neustonica]|uniref:Uncharacterized protein n=1 Tax=Lacinutrix neustonica TaxID=2980107 RepID=A0A9E8SF92_9FLAO|nr:hypothetical protein [Lacinutrix neustonica]WAC03154.1 hypothetical protein N7U66_05960 [Lacinutrix neustonica]
MEDYPFKSLVTLGHVRKACAPFESRGNMSKWKSVLNDKDLLSTHKGMLLHLGGIDVDGAYRVINKKGEVEPRIHDLSFTHTFGLRPYSYGLQACNTTSEIMVHSWLSAAIHDHEEIAPETLSKMYNKIEE